MSSNTTLRGVRLQQACTTCSTTPRTGKARVEELAQRRGQLEEQMYEEAKLCLLGGHMQDALALFRLCSPGFRNTSMYIGQCLQHASMCEDGILLRTATEPWRTALANVPGIPPQSLAVVRYAERLHKNGFQTTHLQDLCVVDAMTECANMSPGHRVALEEHAAAQTPWPQRWVAHVQRAAARCHIDALLREARPWLATPATPAAAQDP